MNDKVRPQRGHTKSRGKGWRKNLAPKRSIREQLGATRHEVYSWQALAQIPKDIFDEFAEKVRVREEKGTIANALRYANVRGWNPKDVAAETPRTIEVTDEELMGLPRIHQIGCDAAQLLKDIDNLERLTGNGNGRELAIAIAFLEGWTDRFGKGLDRLKKGSRR